MEIGVVGLPNVGKSSLFNALTKAGAQASNFPFTTIEPNVGVVDVPDDRLDFLSQVFNSAKKVNTTVTFVDIAGLVKGASQGEGLGNKFLDQIRSVDAIIEVVRCFRDPQVIHVSGNVDPADDIATINTELLLSDLEQLERAKRLLSERIKRQDKEALALYPLIDRGISLLAQDQPIRRDGQLATSLKSFNLLTAKPFLYVMNTDERVDDEQTTVINSIAQAEGTEVLSISVKAELEIVELPYEVQREYREGLGLSSGLDDVITASYRLLNMQTFFTAGPKESHAWTINKGTKAPQAAGKIHSDFERGFIRAEVYHVDDLKRFGSEKLIRENGKLRSEGKDYIVADGDVIEFLFNV